MADTEIKSDAFQLAQLRSEISRVIVVLATCGGLLVLIAIRGLLWRAEGSQGAAWPLAVLVGAMAVYEAAQLRWIKRALSSGRAMPQAAWTVNILVETLLPTLMIFWQIQSFATGPLRALTSPAVLAYFLFIILSTLHLNPRLSELSGALSAAGYGAVAAYVFLKYPVVAAGQELTVYGTSAGFATLLLIGGFAAGAVAYQIRRHVIAALHEAESQATIAQLEHDLGVARSIQEGLLPKAAPQVAGFDIAGWNQPADETGGDYFDWQELSGGCHCCGLAACRS